MSETVSVAVPEAARRLGVSERTIWRRLRRGTLLARRSGRHVMVELPKHAMAEAAAPYRAAPAAEWGPGPWPYTAAAVDRHRRALTERRRAAADAMDRLAALSQPDPEGLSAVDYLRAEREGVELADAPSRRR